VTESADPRRDANRARLRRLKAAALGLSAVSAIGLWSLVSASVEAGQATPDSVTQQTDSLREDRPFFADQPSSLTDASAGRPLMRSGGS
jgi:hypothetical protein